MYPKILHIYGPLYINSFGAAIAIGVAFFVYLVRKTRFYKKYVNSDTFAGIVSVGVLSGIVGGRILYALEDGFGLNFITDLFSFWEPGFSILGSVISIFVSISFYLWINKIPIIPFFDASTVYVPLLQGISRIGCFLAGCCYGTETSVPWALTYTNDDVAAPTFVPLHPTQLYSSITLITIFFVMRFVLSTRLKKTGQLTAMYLMLISCERFMVDFFRGSRNFTGNPGSLISMLSTLQWLALAIFVLATTAFVTISLKSKVKDGIAK